MKILLVCERIAPVQSIGAIRWTKIAKYLKKNYGEKITIDVLTNMKNYVDPNRPMLRTKDTLLEEDMRYFDNCFQVPVVDWIISMAHWCKKTILSRGKAFIRPEEKRKSFLQNILKNKISKIYQIYYSWTFSRTLGRAVKSKAGEYDIIISSYGPIWPFMVCSKLNRRIPI